jgi:dTDP-4-amino-4,6-dideoxygalactose transaminase
MERNILTSVILLPSSFYSTQKFNSNEKSLNELMVELNNSGYLCRPVWRLLNTLPMYKKNPCSPLPIANMLAKSIFNIPSSYRLWKK